MSDDVPVHPGCLIWGSVFLLAAGLLVGLVAMRSHIRTEAVKEGRGKWTVDEKTGDTTWVWTPPATPPLPAEAPPSPPAEIAP